MDHAMDSLLTGFKLRFTIEATYLGDVSHFFVSDGDIFSRLFTKRTANVHMKNTQT